MRTTALFVLLLITALSGRAQQLTATRFIVDGVPWNGTEGALVGTTEPTPLILATTNSLQQPIRFVIGDSGTVAEISSTGSMWFKGSVLINPQTAGSLLLDAQALTNTPSIVIKNIGLSGTETAAIMVSASSNGTGTGLRFGGPVGSLRPTLATSIDVTGGTGFRYNALTAGNGTAIEIGKTTSPVRGVDVLVSGANQVGVQSRANTNGTGIVGLSMSSAYADPTISERVGVKGVSASNSTIASDTIFGIQGIALRGGAGGTQTISIATLGKALSTGTSHAGTAIGIMGTALAVAPGKATSIGVLAHMPSTTNALSVVALGADVYLGSTDVERPSSLTNSGVSLTGTGLSTTHMYSAAISGELHLVGLANHSVLSDSAGFRILITNTNTTQRGKGRVLSIEPSAESPRINLGSQFNETSGDGATIVGGGRISAANVSSKPYSTIIGGAGNTVDAPYAMIGGGGFNKVTGSESVVVGGHDLNVSGKNTLAFGYATTVVANNSIVFHHNDVNPENHTRVGINTSTPESQLDVHGTFAIQAGVPIGLVPGLANNVNIGISSIVPIVADPVVSVLTGCAPTAPGRFVTLVVTFGNLTIANENIASLPAQRIRTSTGADIITQEEAVVTLWYDVTIQRWRVFSVQP